MDDLRFMLTKECPPVPNTTTNRNVWDIYDRWVRANEKARGYILANISNVLNKKHEVMPTALEIMLSLQEISERLLSSVRHEAIKYFYSTRMKDGSNVREYVLDMMVHFNISEGHRTMMDKISQLADHSLVRTLGLVQDMLIRVNGLSFLAHFYVIDVNAHSPPSNLSVLLGRPFLNTTKVVINVDKGSLQIEKGGKFEKNFINDILITTKPICSSTISFQDDDKPPNLGVGDGDSMIGDGYG
ncbi:uncharacterized protein LOC120079919 [Benincasa hispida]|uniref:uncharacterized protein LOC120079919 n=1 Tax=Benincasa hispida TaxID=102211 RepID=UPI0019003E68|nr:uncharacterized protein LOC120079919 [Benincasa hispida]